jgi:hypothetical protein
MKFKTTNPAPAVSQESGNQPQQSRKPFGYCKITQYRFKDGDNLLRFLPQPADSKYNNFVQFEELNFWTAQYKNKLAILPNTATAETRLKAFFELREHFPQLMKNAKNPEGSISLNTSHKVGFQAYDPETKSVVAVVLPGTNPMPRLDGSKRNVGAGTKVVDLCTAKNIKGELRYGDVFDIQEGGLINIRVTNAGTLSASYEVLYESQESLENDEIWGDTLQAIKSFDQVFKFAIPVNLYVALESYLEPEQFEVCKKLFPSGDPAAHAEVTDPF